MKICRKRRMLSLFCSVIFFVSIFPGIGMAGDNNPPIAMDDSITVFEDSSSTLVNVLANDSAAPDIGETLMVTSVTQPAGGTVTFTATDVSFQPDLNFHGTATFTYTISDGNDGTATATVTATVTPVNDPPSAVDDTFTVAEDSSSTVVNVLDNDSIAPDIGETLTLVAVTQPSGGTVTFTAMNVSFQPDSNFHGTTAFTYTISDGNGGTATATVTATVTPVNDPPSANNDTFTVAEDSSSTLMNVLANDSTAPETAETLMVTSVTQPAGGTVTFTATNVSFQPDSNFHGTATFTYTISDGNGGTATATVTVTVTPVNDPPTAEDDEYNVQRNGAATALDVLANDSIAPDTGETLTIAAVTQPAYGTVSFTASVLNFTPAAGYIGTTTFTYSINDGNGGTAAATVTVHVTPVNDPPSAGDDALTVAEDSGATVVDVLANDTSAPDTGETLTVAEVTQAAYGTVSLDAGIVRYTPAANYFGLDSFTYTLSDGNGGTATATVSINVTPVNDPPTLGSDSFTIAEDCGLTSLDVLANDSCAPDTGETLIIISIGHYPAHGSVGYHSYGLDFTPAPNFNGTTTVDYLVQDNIGSYTLGHITIHVTPVNDPPSAGDDALTVAEDSGATVVDVLANDSYWPDTGETLTVAAVTQAAHGTVSLDAGIVRYTPAENFNGTDIFTYTISDGNGGTATATVTATVTPVNDPPTAVNDEFTFAEDSGPRMFNVLANDSCAPDTGETIMVIGYGYYTYIGDVYMDFFTGFTIYTPAENFNGDAQFDYWIRDDQNNVSMATVTIHMTPVNDPPTAVNDEFTVTEDGGITVLDVLANDSCAPESGETLTAIAVTQPSNGTVTLVSGIISYTPAENFHGTDTFTYTISDGNGGTNTATVSVTVTPVNDPPSTAEDFFTVAEDCGLTVLDVLANDSCAPDTGETLTVTAVTGPSNGTVTLVSGVVSYTPAENFHGTDTFTYTISDGNGGTNTATVSVTVTPVNDTPSAEDDFFTVAEDCGPTVLDVLSNDSYWPDTGETLTVTEVIQPLYGTVTLVSGVVTYTPPDNFNGMDAFGYTASDDGGFMSSVAAFVNVTPVNDPPDAVNDSFAVSEDSSATILNVLDNDSCLPDVGETLAVTAVTQPTNGTVTLISGVVSYTPAFNYNGVDTFTYTLSDESGITVTAAVFVTVDPVNDLPALKAGILATASADIKVKGTYRLNLAALFGDIDGDALTFTVVENMKSPVVARANYAYRPTAAGIKTLVFRAYDGQAGATDTYTVTLTVTASEDSSVFAADVATDQSTATLPVLVDADSGDASVDLSNLAQSAQNNSGQLVVTFPVIPQTDLYTVDMPVSVLSGLNQTGTLTIHTDIGSITLPPEMLSGLFEQCDNAAQITIGLPDRNSLPQAVLDAIGLRPLLEVALSIDGSETAWENVQMPFTVSIPYVPTPEEMNNPSNIAVWYINNNGESSRVSGVQYDAQTGNLVFSTTHTGIFTVGRP